MIVGTELKTIGYVIMQCDVCTVCSSAITIVITTIITVITIITIIAIAIAIIVIIIIIEFQMFLKSRECERSRHLIDTYI